METENNHRVKGIGYTKNILYVLSLKKKLLSISFLEDKGDKIVFVDGKVLVWGKDLVLINKG